MIPFAPLRAPPGPVNGELLNRIQDLIKTGFAMAAGSTTPPAPPVGAGGSWVGFSLLAPPAVASASSTGTSIYGARGDHTHALDFVPYEPSLPAVQSRGILQQTYSTPVATPVVTPMAPQQIPFGATTGGILTQGTATNAITWSGTTLTLLRENAGAGPVLVLTNPDAAAGSSSIRFRARGLDTFTISVGTTGVVFLNQTSISPAIVNMQFAGNTKNVAFGRTDTGDFMVGDTAHDILTTATGGWGWQKRINGAPVGVPSILPIFPHNLPMVIDDLNQNLYVYSSLTAAWRFSRLDSPAIIAAGAGVPNFSTAPGAIGSLNALWETFYDSAGVLSYRPYFQ